MKKTKSPKNGAAISQLLEVMAKLRSPEGCPWDREQTHQTLRFHAVEEVYELMDAIEAGDEEEMVEELGDLLLQVVFHCQLAAERKAFDFEEVANRITEKLIRRHPHVFGDAHAKTVEAVWAQWEQIKKSEKAGTKRERASALDGIPRHLPSLLRTEKLIKKARKHGLWAASKAAQTMTKTQVTQRLLALTEYAQKKGWSAEELLRDGTSKLEAKLRRREKGK